MTHRTDCDCPVCEARLTEQVRSLLPRLSATEASRALVRRSLGVAAAPSEDDIARTTLASVFGFDEPERVRWGDVVAAAKHRVRRIAELEARLRDVAERMQESEREVAALLLGGAELGVRGLDYRHAIESVGEMLATGDVDGARALVREVLAPEWSGAESAASKDEAASSPAGDTVAQRGSQASPAGGFTLEVLDG